MILPRADGSLRRVGAVHVWRSVLMRCVVVGYETLDVFRCLVVQFVELGTIASGS